MVELNGYLVVVVVFVVLNYALDLLVETLNLRHRRAEIPPEVAGWIDRDKYVRGLQYLRDTTVSDIVRRSITTPVLLAFLLAGGYRWLDDCARAAGGGLIVTGWIFTGLFVLLLYLLDLPFKVYDTFGIEERYGFNRTTPRTYILDQLKIALVGALVGMPVLAVILWLFSIGGREAWLYAWLAITLIQVLVTFIAPVIFLPLFHKFTPLPAGELKDAIAAYARQQDFRLQGIYTVDGSRRSTKSNAFFTGFGKLRRIALFDTLVKQHGTDELVAVLAHEIGHYRLGHVIKLMLISILASGLALACMSLFLHAPGLYAAFGLDYGRLVGGTPPLYAGLVIFGLLYAPISMVLHLLQRYVSRRCEWQADEYAARTTGKPEALVTALLRLSVESLVDVTPHPLKVVMEYEHPPVLERIRALQRRPVPAPARGSKGP